MPESSLIVHGGAGSGRYRRGDKRFSELRAAVEEGLSAMKRGSSTDAVEAAVGYMEGSGLFNAGKGACLTSAGEVELDAAIMSGKGAHGAGVGAVDCTYQPVSLARWAMENTKHVLLVGEICKAYCREAGLAVEKLRPSESSAEKFTSLTQKGREGDNLDLWQRANGGNTVGAVAVDRDGVPSSAASTGGIWLKLPGRVGDSAILGAGVFADMKSGAACATGIGEDIIRNVLCWNACQFLRKMPAQSAASKSIGLMTRNAGRGTAGIITVDLKGRVGSSHNTRGMGRALFDNARGRIVTGS